MTPCGTVPGRVSQGKARVYLSRGSDASDRWVGHRRRLVALRRAPCSSHWPPPATGVLPDAPLDSRLAVADRRLLRLRAVRAAGRAQGRASTTAYRWPRFRWPSGWSTPTPRRWSSPAWAARRPRSSSCATGGSAEFAYEVAVHARADRRGDRRLPPDPGRRRPGQRPRCVRPSAACSPATRWPWRPHPHRVALVGRAWPGRKAVSPSPARRWRPPSSTRLSASASPSCSGSTRTWPSCSPPSCRLLRLQPRSTPALTHRHRRLETHFEFVSSVVRSSDLYEITVARCWSPPGACCGRTTPSCCCGRWTRTSPPGASGSGRRAR